jgi:hypothetical protein
MGPPRSARLPNDGDHVRPNFTTMSACRRAISGLAAVAMAGTLLTATAGTASAATPGTPRGNVDVIAAGNGAIRVAGWAWDENTSAPVTVAVKVDGVVTKVVADMSRPDVARVLPAAGAARGFQVVFPATHGKHDVQVTAMNAGAGVDKAWDSRSIPVTVANEAPTGWLDTVSLIPGGIRVSGWAVDRDAPHAAVKVRIGVDGKAYETTTGTPRPDVSRVNPGFTEKSGYVLDIPLPAGQHKVDATGLNTPLGGNPGENRSFRNVTVTVPAGSPVATPGPAAAPVPAGAEGTDSTFTIAVMPDTQTDVFGSDRITNRAQWLVKNRDALDLRFVLHTGDVVNWDTPDHQQYVNASASLKPLEDAKIPTTLAIGNHDTNAVGEGGSARAGVKTWEAVRDTTTFNRYFPPARYGVEGTFEPGKIDNNYQLFSAGGEDWMILTLELWARPQAIEWAKQVVAANPGRNVLVMTHAYLDASGSISTSNGGYGSTSPKYLFDNLISKYPNIKMVFSGHVGAGTSRTDTGVNGNKIVSYLGCYHSSTTNPIRLVEIDTKKDTISTRVYSPNNNQTITGAQAITGVTFD